MTAGEPAEELAETLGHQFARPELLTEALTHSSAALHDDGGRRRQDKARGYERLEFLGDRVLGLIVAELLWHRFPNEPEGKLTRRHAQLVRRETLTEVGRELDLSRFIRLSVGEASSEIRHNASLLADVCEAVIAAIYLDGGLAAAARFIGRHWEPRIAAASEPPQDPKTALQEWAQARVECLPRYEIVSVDGPPHRRVFTAKVTVEGFDGASGTGSSKRAAETSAAAALLAQLAERASP
jgi:ribonuclease III